MAQRKSKSGSSKTRQSTKSQQHAKIPHRREITAVCLLILGLFTLIGYFGGTGAFIGLFYGLGKGLVGPGFYSAAPILLLCSVLLFFHRGRPVRFRIICTLLITVVLGGICHLFIRGDGYTLSFKMIGTMWTDGRALKSGGAVAGSVTELFVYLFSEVGAAVVLVLAALFLLLAALNKTVAGVIDAYKNRTKLYYTQEPDPQPETHDPIPKKTKPNRKRTIDIPLDGETQPLPLPQEQNSFFNSNPRVKTPDQAILESIPERDTTIPDPEDKQDDVTQDYELELDIPFMDARRTLTTEPTASVQEAQRGLKPIPSKKEPRVTPIEIKTDTDVPEYKYPPIELLTQGIPASGGGSAEEVRMNSDRLEHAFRSFGINVKVSNATRGPSVTQYEAELEAGIKLSRITGLADDIALSLGVSGVRIAALPGKISTVGIEVPNKLISKVLLRDIIESREFRTAKSKLTFAIGKNISGESVVGNISKLPHMLVAGTTGSGKSVCLNSIILSIMYKASPKDVRFIMIDPKMVEFRVYNNIPHLLVPVVTDVKKAAGALQWAVVEMMRRYKLFSETNARDLESYNALQPPEGETLPQIVIFIDELADLMMTAAKEVEESVCRVAQMGRAAGVHLIIATQSPRADVITGLMKANIPSRIALKVSSALESRIILDAGGNADKLVGNGDMLYAPIGTTKPVRIQGTWVTDAERESVVEHVRQSDDTQYSQEVITQIEKIEKPTGDSKDKELNDDSTDEMLPQAVEIMFETGQASVSMLQRKLKLGYARAARIVDQMEKLGIVGPYEGSKPRQLLVTKLQWREMQFSTGNAPLNTLNPISQTDNPHTSTAKGETN